MTGNIIFRVRISTDYEERSATLEVVHAIEISDGQQDDHDDNLDSDVNAHFPVVRGRHKAVEARI